MARFLVDMNLATGLAQGLRRIGHDAVHLREQSLQTLPDEEILAKAGIERRIIVTKDRGFGALVAAMAGPSVSTIVLRIHVQSADRLVTAVTETAMRFASDLESGALIIVEDGRTRVRSLTHPEH